MKGETLLHPEIRWIGQQKIPPDARTRRVERKEPIDRARGRGGDAPDAVARWLNRLSDRFSAVGMSILKG